MKKMIALLSTMITFAAVAQNTLPTPRNIQLTYDRGTRSITGAPGKNYWQNSADYSIHVNFFPATRLLSGNEDIVYTNNSPAALRQIYFKLYPNLYKKGSPRDRSIAPDDVSDGLIIDQMSIDDIPFDISKLRENGTNMVVQIPQLASGKTTHFNISYHYT